jgi:hypothetical protein
LRLQDSLTGDESDNIKANHTRFNYSEDCNDACCPGAATTDVAYGTKKISAGFLNLLSRFDLLPSQSLLQNESSRTTHITIGQGLSRSNVLGLLKQHDPDNHGQLVKVFLVQRGAA